MMASRNFAWLPAYAQSYGAAVSLEASRSSERRLPFGWLRRMRSIRLNGKTPLIGCGAGSLAGRGFNGFSYQSVARSGKTALNVERCTQRNGKTVIRAHSGSKSLESGYRGVAGNQLRSVKSLFLSVFALPVA